MRKAICGGWGWMVRRGVGAGMAWVGGHAKIVPKELAGFPDPCLKSRHNYSISMLSCTSVFLYSSNLSQPTRHMRPSEKEPVRGSLCPQPSTPLPSPSHWLLAVEESQRKARGIMGAARALVALGVIDKILAKRVNHHSRMKSELLLKVRENIWFRNKAAVF